MNHLDLFSGIGGFSLAARWVWGEAHHPIFCEIDQFCQKVLREHWPNAKIFSDIKELTYEQIMDNTNGLWCGQKQKEPSGYSGRNFTNDSGQRSSNRRTEDTSDQSKTEKIQPTIDLLTGGFPCQPFSVAGKRQGEADDRYLWPEMLRIISGVKPRWIIGENVTGILNMGFDDMLTDLEAEGYEVETLIIPACAVGAKHRRDRVWIVANAEGMRSRGKVNSSANERQEEIETDVVSDTEKTKCKQSGNTWSGRSGFTNGDWWSVEPDVGRMAHGIPRRVDRLKGLGNAIVPQVAQVIMKIIKKIDEEF